MKNFATRALTLGMLSVTLPSAVQAGSLLTTWNVIVTGDAYVKTETEGPVRVGGDLHTAGGQYGITPRAGTLDGTGGVGLMVGGNVVGADHGGVKLNSGASAVIGGSSTQADRFANGSVTVNDPSVPLAVAGDAALLQGYSLGFAALAANNAFADLGNAGLFKVTNTDANGNAVFNVTTDDVFRGSFGQLTLDLNGHAFGDGQSIIINISGDVSGTNGINFIGDFSNNNHAAVANLIWNFTDATSINLNGGNFSGTMLAHNATLTNTETIEGSVFVKQIGTSLNPFDGQKAEIHPPLYKGFVPETQAVPEPASLVMVGIAALTGGAILGVRHRRSA